MALNDNVLDDLHNNGVVDDDLVVSPGQQTLPAETTVVGVNTDTNNQQSSILSAEDTEKLLNSNIVFKLVEDGHTKLIDLKDVESNIMGQESMDQKAAAYIDKSFGNYVTESYPIQMFSEKPTGINFKHACQFMRTRIAQEEAQVISNYEILLASFNDTIDVVERSMTYLQVLKDLLNTVRYENTDLSKLLQENKNLVVPYNNDFINITTASIGIFDFKQIQYPNIDSGVFAKYLSAIKEIFESNTVLKSFILQNIDQPFGIDAPITICDLVRFFEEDRLYLFDSLDREFKERVDRLKEIREFGAGNIQIIEKQLTENSGEISKINNFLLDRLKAISSMIFLLTTVKSLFKELKKL